MPLIRPHCVGASKTRATLPSGRLHFRNSWMRYRDGRLTSPKMVDSSRELKPPSPGLLNGHPWFADGKAALLLSGFSARNVRKRSNERPTSDDFAAAGASIGDSRPC